MKKTLTLALLFCIGTAIGQVTKYALPYKSDTLRGYAYFSDTLLTKTILKDTTIGDGFTLTPKSSNILPSYSYSFTPKYTLSDDFAFWYRNKQYKVEELVEMLEWFRENKPKKDTTDLSKYKKDPMYYFNSNDEYILMLPSKMAMKHDDVIYYPDNPVEVDIAQTIKALQKRLSQIQSKKKKQ